jgi:hydrophobic/amphiphilic exporter-1 (mainly G- bacteria), HAE1 family
VEASVDGIDGVTKVTSSRTADQPVVQVTVDRAAADTAGLSEAAVAQTVAGLLNDLNLGQVDLGDGPQDVVLHLQDAPVDLDALRAATLTTPNGSVALDDVADVERVTMPAVITRTDGQRTVTVSVTPDSDELGSVSGQLATTTADLDLPAGATVTVGGAASDQASAFNDLGMAMLAAIFVVFIVMVAALSSIGQALILLVSIPFAATGALLGLLVTDIPLGVPALVGLLMLVGIVVSNAIVLIDLINQYRAAGRSIHEAVTEGSRQRLRPIVMTAAATIFALSPMAVGFTGGGGFIAQPLAVVVIGGLLSSTLLTLVVVPVLYVLTQRSAERRAARKAARMADADHEALAPEGVNV